MFLMGQPIATKTAKRGNYYAYTLSPSTRPGSTAKIAHEVGRQVHSPERARALVDATGLPGYVEHWSERTQRRTTVANRDQAGNWTTTNPYTGETVPC